MRGASYRSQTFGFLGRTPNHDDNVEAYSLGKGYDITAKAWKARFGVPYSVCGCVPDPDPESRLSKFASKIANIGSKKEKPDPNGPPPVLVNHRPDLVATELSEADSSHPSEHNLQWGEASGDPHHANAKVTRDARERRSQKYTEKAKKAAHKDPWRALQAERKEKRRDRHREAFTDPHLGYGSYYPYWGVSAAVPYGYVI